MEKREIKKKKVEIVRVPIFTTLLSYNECRKKKSRNSYLYVGRYYVQQRIECLYFKKMLRQNDAIKNYIFF